MTPPVARKCTAAVCRCRHCGTYGENGPPTEEQVAAWRARVERIEDDARKKAKARGER